MSTNPISAYYSGVNAFFVLAMKPSIQFAFFEQLRMTLIRMSNTRALKAGLPGIKELSAFQASPTELHLLRALVN
jgi:hypothetical protein